MFEYDGFVNNHGNHVRWGPERRLVPELPANPVPQRAQPARRSEPEHQEETPGPDWAEVREEIVALSSAIAAAQARILELVATHGSGLTGGDDPATWLAWAAGMKPGSARRHIRLGERLMELPQIKESFKAGEISFDKVETIARVASNETEEGLLTWAKHGTCSQLATIASGFRRAKVSAEGAAAAQRDRCLSYHYTDEGVFRLRAQMPADQGAVVAAALEAAEEMLWEQERTFSEEEVSADDLKAQVWHRGNGSGARRADALVAFAETFMTHGISDRPVAERYQVMVHVDQAALAGDQSGTSELHNGTGISTDTARRIACDCSVMALLEKDGIPLKLGRTRRTISPALRRVVAARDRHCVWPGCTNTRCIDGHHVKHWIDDGKTDPDNVTLLCRRHHRLVHEGGYTMTFDGKTATFFRPDGSEVERVPTHETLSEVELAEWRSASATDLDTWSHWIDPCNYSDAVAWLCDNDADLRELAEAGARAGPG